MKIALIQQFYWKKLNHRIKSNSVNAYFLLAQNWQTEQYGINCYLKKIIFYTFVVEVIDLNCRFCLTKMIDEVSL